ncbi:MAG: hypothetical protein LEGION0398_MBIBDBAK_00299 [Legionellaceae bacterium]
MTTLKDFLDNIDTIEEIAEKLGILNIRLINMGDNTLNLLVSINREISNANKAILLEAKLIEMLNCETAVIVDSKLKPLVKETIINGAVPIRDIQNLEKLFNNSPQNIKFNTITLVERNRLSLRRKLELANEYINDSTSVSFFKNSDKKLNVDFQNININENSPENGSIRTV